MDQAELIAVLRDHQPTAERPANILRTLMAIEERFGHVPAAAIAPVARALGVPEADVAGVVSYYPDLHTKPHGRHILRLCLGEACVANGSSRLLADLKPRLRIGLGETTADGRLTIERVYCLGNCAVGPTVMVDDQLYGRVTDAQLASLIESFR
ncbi:MAG TPA: NAD(P)H-dependent oxidoreductase subunit E [Nitrospira sp.]|nr:NAD(P)H-dependent oxidoreductase subunit E [Nitrospira sp.]